MALCLRVIKAMYLCYICLRFMSQSPQQSVTQECNLSYIWKNKTTLEAREKEKVGEREWEKDREREREREIDREREVGGENIDNSSSNFSILVELKQTGFYTENSYKSRI